METELIDSLVEFGVLTFGDFITKSGRATPYFLNFGQVRTGSQISRLANAYADRIVDVFGRDVDVLFGPAYKGIPLVATTAIALQQRHGLDVGFCFNRKEAKDHGEGGMLVGHEPRNGDRIVIVEDVTTAGTSIRETMPLLTANAEVDVCGLIVCVDRQERSEEGTRSALDVIAEKYGLTATAITTIDVVIDHLRDRLIDGERVLSEEDLARIEDYRARWGA